MAFLFGLLHGCGFASALANLELAREQQLSSLFFVNLGVELGHSRSSPSTRWALASRGRPPLASRSSQRVLGFAR